MPASWKGSINISLVSVPVQGFNALDSRDTITFNQLHEECHSRIRYKKVCEVHGEVPNDEIVMGYQFAKDQYVVIDPDEIEKLRSERDRSINVDRFVDPTLIDPVYFSGQTYYLTPHGKAAEKAYSLLLQAMVDENVCGLAQVVLMNREQLVMLRPLGALLSISVLNYHANLKDPEQFVPLKGEAKASKEELKLAKTLVGAIREKQANLEAYRDLRQERMKELVDAKVAGREIVATKSTKSSPPTIDIMAAIKASLATKGKKMAASARSRGTAAKKRKTG